MTRDQILALCLVTQSELDRLGASFDRAYPIDESPCFGDLLAAIDAAEQRLQTEEAAPVPGGK